MAYGFTVVERDEYALPARDYARRISGLPKFKILHVRSYMEDIPTATEKFEIMETFFVDDKMALLSCDCLNEVGVNCLVHQDHDGSFAQIRGYVNEHAILRHTDRILLGGDPIAGLAGINWTNRKYDLELLPLEPDDVLKFGATFENKSSTDTMACNFSFTLKWLQEE
jgi:hypothetical protein